MSRIGKVPITVPSDVTVTLGENNSITAKGKLGELSRIYHNNVVVSLQDNIISVARKNPEDKKAAAVWGLTRSLINNMVVGVSKGFSEVLEISGVGYKVSIKGNILTLFLGFSHEIKYLIPEDLTIKCPSPTVIEIFGNNKEKVGQFAADIRRLRPPEPYKLKGIKRKGEVIIKKEGKKK